MSNEEISSDSFLKCESKDENEKEKETEKKSNKNEEKIIKIYNNKNIEQYKIKKKGRVNSGPIKLVPRLSCQPFESITQQNNNLRVKGTIKKKTTVETREIKKSMNIKFLTPIFQFRPSVLEEGNNNKNNNSNKKNNNDFDNLNLNVLSLNDIKKIKLVEIIPTKLNIYERSKKDKIRKENYINKKKEIQEKNLKKTQTNDKKTPRKKSSKNLKYSPLYKRAVKLYREHLLEIEINENRKKKEEEEKEKEIIKIYKKANKKKTFNKNNWEKFLKNQEDKLKTKKYKAKVEEILKDFFAMVNSVPSISLNSQKIIKNKRKNHKIKDVHIRLFDEFDTLQEKKRLRMCNSMPSFKPLLNKSPSKNLFQTKKSYNKTMNNFDRKIESYVNKKLNKTIAINLKKHYYNQTSNKNFMNSNNNSGIESSFSNFVYKNNTLKNNLNNKKSRYDYTIFDNQRQHSRNCKGNKSQSILHRSELYNKHRKNDASFNYKNWNKNKNFSANKNNNSVIFNGIINEEK